MYLLRSPGTYEWTLGIPTTTGHHGKSNSSDPATPARNQKVRHGRVALEADLLGLNPWIELPKFMVVVGNILHFCLL